MKHSTIGQSAPPAPIALADQSASDHSTRHDGWSPSRQATFLRALAATHSVSHAAAQAGMSRQSAYALRARLKGEPFDLAWHAALRCRLDALAEAALERALHGVEVQHFYHGELTHTSRRYDERLTVALLAMRERLGPPPRVRPTHPAAGYGPEDFGPLLERVEHGAQTWDEGLRQEYESLYDEYEGEDETGAEEEAQDDAHYDGERPEEFF